MKHPRPVHPPNRLLATASVWRSAEGHDKPTCVGRQLQTWIALGYLPEVGAAAEQCIRLGRFCGLSVEDSEGRRTRTGRPTAYLVTEPALTACLAGSGIECSTPAHLHRALGELVVAGHLERVTEVRNVATLGPVAFYRFHASILGRDDDMTEAPDSPPQPKPALRVISALRSSPLETTR